MKRSVIALLPLLALAPACKKSAPTEAPAEQQAAAQPQTEFRYAGTLSCADCKGIRTELSLFEDPERKTPAGYRLKETYTGTPDGEREFASEGEWSVEKGRPGEAEATIIVLTPDDGSNDRNFLELNDRELRLLDDNLMDLDIGLDWILTRQ